ncbi:MAG: hypothetical protein ACFE96_08630 [Candidatus Hermodarchaeota archaeon]
MSFNTLLVELTMDGNNSQKDVWLRYCEECVKSKIEKKPPQDFPEEPRETKDTTV